ncbi:MAG: c-type cytochrome [Acidobacteriota bacterium]
MTRAWTRVVGVMAGALCFGAVMVQAQAPPQGGREGAPPAGRGGRGAQGGAAAPAPTGPVAAFQVPRSPQADAAAAEAGRPLWVANCITCHGTNARGSDTGANLVRSEVANYDRSAQRAGMVIGPFLKKGHPTQSGKPSASFTDDEIFQLANFVRQKINDTMRGSPTYIVTPESILTGDAKVGEAFFKGEGGCTTCHNATSRNLDGIASRITSPQTLQGRVLYPSPGGLGGGRRGGGGGRGAPVAAAPVGPPPGPQPPSQWAAKVTITPATGPAVSGALVSQDSFFITYADPTGIMHTVRKTPGMKVKTDDPMQWHIDFANRITDKQMHDLTAYLWSLK